MASTVIQPVADAIGAILAGMGITVKTYVWAPRDLDAVPAAVVELPDVVRTQPEDTETELGSTDWRMAFPVVLYFDLAEAFSTQTTAAEYVEKLAAAVDAHPTLSGTVDDSKMTQAQPAYPAVDDARPLLTYECTVSVLKLVAQS